MHHKKRRKPRRRNASVRGCCGMCMAGKRHDLHHRILSRQEVRAKLAAREQET